MTYKTPREKETEDLMFITANVGVDLVGKPLLRRLKYLHSVELMIKHVNQESTLEKLKKLGI